MIGLGRDLILRIKEATLSAMEEAIKRNENPNKVLVSVVADDLLTIVESHNDLMQYYLDNVKLKKQQGGLN